MNQQILNPQQLDAFTEVINIAVGKAAETLSLMIDRQVSIQTPHIELIAKSELMDRFKQRFGAEALGVSIEYSGLMEGVATLFFEATEGKTLVDQLLAENKEDDWDDWDDDTDGIDSPSRDHGFTDSDKEALVEVGNLMINSLLGSVSNLVGGQLTYEAPELNMHFNFIEEFLSLQQGQAFVIESVFREQQNQVEGLLSIHFDLGNFLDTFLTKLDHLSGSTSAENDDF